MPLFENQLGSSWITLLHGFILHNEKLNSCFFREIDTANFFIYFPIQATIKSKQLSILVGTQHVHICSI